MAIGWYIAPYNITTRDVSSFPNNVRYCAMKDYNNIIRADGGTWSETEVLGDRAVVKVRASSLTLSILDGVFTRMPKDEIEDSLAAVSIADKAVLKVEGLDMGYTNTEWEKDFPNNLGTYQLKDVLNFYTKRRLKPRYDYVAKTIKVDGIEQKCKSIEAVDAKVI